MQMISRRSFVRTVTGTALTGTAAFAAACGVSEGTSTTGSAGSAGTASQPAKAASTQPATLYWSAWGGGERVDQYKNQAERFTKAHPHIKVEFIAQSGNYNEQITAMLASNTQLDVARLDGYVLASYVAKNQLVQLDPIMNADKTFKKANYLDGVFLEHHQVFQGKTYALPSGDSPRVVWYNTAAWKSAGQADPNELEAKGQWTWDAYLSALKAIAKGTGEEKTWGGRAYLAANTETWPWIHMAGGQVLSKDLKSVVIDQPQALQALEWQLDLMQKHRVAPGPNDKLPGGAFENGKLASFISGNWDAQGFKLKNFQDYSIAPLPKGPKGRFTTFKPNGLTMPVATKHREQAWQLVRWLTDDIEKEYVDSGIFMAFRKDNVEYFLKNFPGPNAKWFVEPFTKKEVIPVDVTKHWPEMSKIMNGELAAVQKGEKSVKDAAGEIKRLVEPLLKQG